MAQQRFTAAQIAAKLEVARRLEAQRAPVSQVCRELGVAELTYLRWQRKYAALDVTAVSRLRMLEDENARLRRAVTDLAQVLEDLQVQLGDISAVRNLSAVKQRG